MRHSVSIYSILGFMSMCFFAACASYKLEVANVSLYNEGVQIVDSVKSQSKVRLEVGQQIVGGVNTAPLALFVSALNLSSRNVMFDRESVSLYQNDKLVATLSDKEVKSANFDFGYIIESYHLFVPPVPVQSQPMGIPLIYRGYFTGFYIYDEMIFSARERMRRQIELDAQQLKRSIIVSSMLQKDTLEPKSPPKGGFILYAPSTLKTGELKLFVRVGEEVHTFILELKK